MMDKQSAISGQLSETLSALDELLNIPTRKYTPLQAAVIYLSGRHPEDAKRAADELTRLLRIEAELIKVHKWVSRQKFTHTKMANESRFVTIREAALSDANNFHEMEKRIADALTESETE